MSSDFKIRLATNSDREKIIWLVESILPKFGFGFDTETSEADLTDIEATYFQTGGMFAVAENAEGDLIGTCAMLPIDRKTCKLRKMYAAPSARGVGLGKKLLEYAIDFARQAGFEMMILETVNTMTAAIRLYTRAGFKLIDGAAASPRCDRVYRLELKKQD